MLRALQRHFIWIGIGCYMLSLLAVSVCFHDYRLHTEWLAWGIGTVLFFFLMSYGFTQRWARDDSRKFLQKAFWTALALRAVYVVAMLYYYYYRTYISFEFGAADSIGYHLTASHMADLARQGQLGTIFQQLNDSTMGFSDQGYVLYLTTLYTLFGKNVLGPRLLKAILSASLCIAVYRITRRNMGEKTARLATVMTVFLPQFIHYTGTYLKETELIGLLVWAMERVDYLIHSKKITFWNVFIPFLLTALTFGLRTIVGMILIGSYAVAIIMADTRLMAKKAKYYSLGALLLVILAFLITPIGKEMLFTFKLNFKESGFLTWKYQQLGMKYAEYAHFKYMAPGAFALPLTNLVEVANENQKLMNGTYFVKNYLAYFAMWCLVVVFREKKWRSASLVGSFTLVYVLVIAFSFAANSERYHLPALPGIVIMAAYAMTHFRRKDFGWYYAYCALLVVAIVGWNYLKLSARGLIP